MYKLKEIKKILKEHGLKNEIINSIVKSLTLEKDARGKIYRFIQSDGEDIKQLEPWMLRHLNWKNNSYKFKSDKKTIEILKDVQNRIGNELPGEYSELIPNTKAISYRKFKSSK